MQLFPRASQHKYQNASRNRNSFNCRQNMKKYINKICVDTVTSYHTAKAKKNNNQVRYQVNLTHIVNDSKKIRLKNKERHGKHKTYRRQFVTHE